MIETTLNLQQAEALFAENAFPVLTVFKGVTQAVPVFRIIELFGNEIGRWVEENIGIMPDEQGLGVLSRCSPFARAPHNDEPFTFITKEGFDFIVAEHNVLIASKQAHECEAGKQWDEIWTARRARLAALDAEEDRKREERKAKRAAARKKKQESEASA